MIRERKHLVAGNYQLRRASLVGGDKIATNLETSGCFEVRIRSAGNRLTFSCGWPAPLHFSIANERVDQHIAHMLDQASPHGSLMVPPSERADARPLLWDV